MLNLLRACGTVAKFCSSAFLAIEVMGSQPPLPGLFISLLCLVPFGWGLHDLLCLESLQPRTVPSRWVMLKRPPVTPLAAHWWTTSLMPQPARSAELGEPIDP